MKLTDADIEQLKEKHENLQKLTVTDSKGETHDFVFRRINREEIDAATKMGNASPTKALEVQMTSSCVFGAKDLIMNDTEVFRAIQSVWHEVQKVSVVELGKL